MFYVNLYYFYASRRFTLLYYYAYMFLTRLNYRYFQNNKFLHDLAIIENKSVLLTDRFDEERPIIS